MPSCRHCKQAYEITKDDLLFYEKVSPEFAGKKQLIPPPTLCPECREVRRMAWRNERGLYHRKCDLSGKQIISMYPPESPFPVFDQHLWWGDDWDSNSYGRDFDFQRTFFSQFSDLLVTVPRLSLSNSNNENCDYVNYTNYSKDCYLIFGNHTSERCCYGWRVHNCEDCLDSSQLNRCKRCYECNDCDDCYELSFSRFCQNCSTSSYLSDCIGCSDCLYCFNLVHQKYCIFNIQYERDEYFEKKKWLFNNPKAAQDSLREFRSTMPCKSLHITQSEQCTGDYLVQCKNSDNLFSAEKCRDCARIYLAEAATDCRDCTIVGWPAELCYEGISTCVQARMNILSSLCWSCSDIAYCDSCFYSKNLFGCTGMKKNEYCILNKQYTKDEYERLVPKIIEKMRADKEWGEFFPVQLSPFCYNETVAQEYFPLSRKDVLERGWKWHDEAEKKDQYLGPPYEIPDSITDVSDEITKQILICEAMGKPYKIIPQELAFYREMQIPIPRKCPDQRHRERMALRNPRKLWNRTCAKCQRDIQTTYAPDRPEIICCEACYLKEVY